MLSDENIEKAIETVNKAHRWNKGHHPNATVMWVEATMEERIKELRQIILDGFEPQQPTLCRRYDRNAKKWRDISIPALYPDQYVHHILIQVLEPVMMRGMDYFCCGSIKGRGVHWGVKHIQKWMRNDIKGTRWCGEMDIYHFYEQIKPHVIMKCMKRLVKDGFVLDLIERVMKYGITIGTYFSQWFANTLLQGLDALIRKCGAKHYIRYMDNITVFASKKRVMRNIVKAVRKWLTEHELQLKDNWQYFRTSKRMPNALGYRYGHGYTLIRKNRILNIRRQIKSYYRQRGNVSAKFAAGLLSRISGLLHCNGRRLREKYIPKGLLKALKDIVRREQKTYATWEECMLRYRMEKGLVV